MTPSFAHLQGTTYKPIDADGAFSGSYCFGEIRTDFRIFGNREYTLRSCTLSNSNNDADNLIVAEKVTVGRLRGSGTVLRTGMNQPTWPGWFNCLNGPCVIAAEAQQTITMHPWMDKLALTASPTEVYEGDSVTFTPSVSGGMTLIAGSPRWMWVPHQRALGGQVQTDPPDTQTGVCANGTVTCGAGLSHGEHVSARESASGDYRGASVREGGGQATQADRDVNTTSRGRQS